MLTSYFYQYIFSLKHWNIKILGILTETKHHPIVANSHCRNKQFAFRLQLFHSNYNRNIVTPNGTWKIYKDIYVQNIN